MLNSSYTGDFSFILTNLWRKPSKESPRGLLKNITIEHFLRDSLDRINNMGTQPISNQTLSDLNAWVFEASSILPEATMLVNFTRAILLLQPDYQWNTYSEYRERKMQNESCYLTKVKHPTKCLASFYLVSNKSKRVLCLSFKQGPSNSRQNDSKH